MPLIKVPIYSTRNLATEVDSGARTILPGTNITFTTAADGIITINAPGALGGDVVGPASSVDNRVVLFNGATGKIIKDSGVLMSQLALLASPVFTGNPTAPTPAPGDNDTSIATTAFVTAAITAGVGPYVLKAGDTMTGTLNGTNIVMSGTITTASIIQSSTLNLVLGTGSAGGIFLRPNGQASGVGQAVLNSAGLFSVVTLDASSTITANNTINSLGASAAYNFQNRSGAQVWAIYNTANITRLYNGTTDVLTVDSSGNVVAGGTLSDVIGNVRQIPQVVNNASAAFVLADAGKHKIKTNGTAYTYTVPTNASVAFPIGTAITIVNTGGTANNITLALAGGVTLYRSGVSGGFAVAPGNMVTLLKIGTDSWQA